MKRNFKNYKSTLIFLAILGMIFVSGCIDPATRTFTPMYQTIQQGAGTVITFHASGQENEIAGMKVNKYIAVQVPISFAAEKVSGIWGYISAGGTTNLTTLDATYCHPDIPLPSGYKWIVYESESSINSYHQLLSAECYLKDNGTPAGEYPLTWVYGYYGTGGDTWITEEAFVSTVNVAATATYSITGSVTIEGAASVKNRTISLSGAATAVTTTDNQGNYIFSGLGNGAYTVTPGPINLYGVSPANRSVNINGANATLGVFTYSLLTYSISGKITSEGGAINIGNRKIYLSSVATITTTTDASGNYSFTGLPFGGTYTITPETISGKTSVPASRACTLTFNVTGMNFTYVPTAPHTISGNISGPTGFPKSGQTITLSINGITSTVQTDASGTYIFSNVYPGNFTIIPPSIPNYSCSVAGWTGTVLCNNVTGINFTYSLIAFTIGGGVSGISPKNNRTIYLSGAATGTTTTDAAGGFYFHGLSNGAYTLTPEAIIGYSVSPSSIAVTVNGSDQTSNFFTYTDTVVPAAVSDLRKNGKTSTSVSLAWTAPGDDGTTGQATTYDLRYSLAPIVTSTNWNAATQVGGETPPKLAGSPETFTVNGLTPANTYYFAIKTIDDVGNISLMSNTTSETTAAADTTAPAAVTDLHKTGKTSTSVSLAWTAPGDDGITGEATTYDVRYSTSNITAGAWSTATQANLEPYPKLAGSPETFTVNGLTPATTYYFAIKTSDEAGNISGLSNITSETTVAIYSISGNISGPGGFLAGNRTIYLSGAATATTTTAASGNYSFPGLNNGSYTVTPQTIGGYNVSPETISVNIAGASQTGKNFTYSAITYSISGTISGPTGFIVSNETISLSGGATKTVTTDASGTYCFSGLSNGSYTVTPPTIGGYTVAPPSTTVTISGASGTGINFNYTSGTSFSISGTISGPTGFIVSNETITLSGSATKTATTDASGNYCFSGLSNGTYTVTPPTIGGYTVAPPSTTVTISGVNRTGISFVYALPLAPPTNLRISVVSGKIKLDWNASPTPMISGYKIYRSEDPAFTSFPSSPCGTVAAGVLTWTDSTSTSVGDPNVNYFYTVKAYNGAGASTYCQPVGEMDFELIHNSNSTSYTWIAIPFAGSGINSASALAAAIGSPFSALEKWGVTAQSFNQSYTTGDVDFAIGTGEVIRVTVSATKILTLTGKVPAPGEVRFNIQTTPQTDYNLISVPLYKYSTITDSAQLFNSISPLPMAVEAWGAAPQSFAHIYDGSGTAFPVRAGYPYRVTASAAANWQ